MTGAGIEPRRLGVCTRARLRLRHARWIAADVRDHAAVERLWWLVPFAVLLGLLAAAIASAQVAVPVAVYTLF